jgi:hypothetical protein
MYEYFTSVCSCIHAQKHYSANQEYRLCTSMCKVNYDKSPALGCFKHV